MSDQAKSLLFEYFEFDRVTREGLSLFPDIVGYYEAGKPKIYRDKMLDLFFDHFSQDFSNCQLYCSLTDFFVTSDVWGEYEHQVGADLSKRGWFQFDKSDDDVATKFVTASLIDVPMCNVRDACVLYFGRFVYGYIFFIWPEKKLLAYPHIKEGFGFVAKPGTVGEVESMAFLQNLTDSATIHVELLRQGCS